MVVFLNWLVKIKRKLWEEVYSLVNRKMSVIDPLTGLMLQHPFRSAGINAMKVAHRSGFGMAVVFIDLDGFGEINANLGHPGGNRILKSIGEIFRDVLRDTDIACRFGGDEFVLMLLNTDEDLAKEVINKRLIPQFDCIDVRFSYGISEMAFPDGRKNIEFEKIFDNLIDEADGKLYAMKELKRKDREEK